MNEDLTFVDASKDEHFTAMSLIHALGWRAAYRDAIPADYMAQEITDDRWIPSFRGDYETSRCHGLLLYRGVTPVACINYGRARAGAPDTGAICTFDSRGYEGWGEIVSFYTHPEETGKGYGGLLFEQALCRLRAEGFSRAYVLVLRENAGARRFYAAHGFQWDGTHEDIPFPHGVVCVDLRYTRTL